MTDIATTALAEIIKGWKARGNVVDHLPDSSARLVRTILAGQRDTIGIDTADRLLIALDMPGTLNEIAPPPKPPPLRSTPRPDRKISPEQIKAAHKLHWDGGMSINELGRQLWQRLGYSSAVCCANQIGAAFQREGLPRRDTVAASVAASTTHGLAGFCGRKPGYRRWLREQHDHRKGET